MSSIQNRYEKPSLLRQRGGVTNKFGVTSVRKSQAEIEGISVDSLVSKYGSPLFVYSEKTIRKSHRDLMAAFTHRYPRVVHAWSFKTNYLRGICREFQIMGSWAEVVSMMEFEMALKLGYSPEQVIFNGPYKPYPDLLKALSLGAIVNVDSLDEIEDVRKAAGELGRPVSVGIRINMSLGSCMSWDRYGFNIESGAALAAVKELLHDGNVRLVGIHSHIGTFVYESDLYRNAIQKVIDFHKVIKAEFAVKIDYLDMGGGFASRNRLKGAYLSTADMVPSYDRYAEAITEPLLKAYAPSELPLLILESGRSLIDAAGTLVSTVVSTKKLNNDKRGLVLDAGVNLLFTAFWYDHDIVPTLDRGLPPEDHVLYGPLCMQIDVVRDTIRLPPLERGDRVLIRPVGAYNNTQWMQFITLRPSVVMISERGEVDLLRQAESVDYLQQGERMPPWLND